MSRETRRATWVNLHYMRQPAKSTSGSHIVKRSTGESLCGKPVIDAFAHDSERTCKDCSALIQALVKEEVPE